MPVRYLESNDIVATVPRRERFRLLEDRLSPAEFSAIESALNEKIDGDEIHTSSWMPGSDWNGTPYQAIYDRAARGNFDLSAQLFGLMVFYVFMNRPETWITGRFEKDGEPIRGRTYFRDRGSGA
jgi:hypothetical protein